MSPNQRAFAFWLAVMNVNEAIKRGQGRDMLVAQKEMRKQIGWRFRQVPASEMLADISRITGLDEEEETSNDGLRFEL